MDEHTRTAKAWLDERYRRDGDGLYFAHQPIYGLETDHSEPNAILRLARTFRLLKIFENLQFDSFLDVGGGEGYVAALVRDLFDVTIVHNSDLSSEACFRAREIFDIQSVATDATKLPFLDDSYDLVFCSEVIEHLSYPALTISELARIARKYVVITTSEFCPLGEAERTLRLYSLDTSYPHAEQNWFTQQDFRILLGNEIFLCSQLRNLDGRAPLFFSNLSLTRAQVEKTLDFLTMTSSLDLNHHGVVVIAPQAKAKIDFNITDSYPLSTMRRQQFLDRLLKTHSTSRTTTTGSLTPDMTLVQRLACLVCLTRLDFVEDQLICPNCGHAYQASNRIPQMFLDSRPSARSVTNTNAVAFLAHGDEERASRIRSLMTKLHGKRPLCSDPLRRAIAKQLLRILWFLRRSETVGTKAKRIIKRLKNEPPPAFDAINEFLLDIGPGS